MRRLRESRHDSGRWEAVCCALDSNARTFRYCLMVTIFPVAVAVITELMRHTPVMQSVHRDRLR